MPHVTQRFTCTGTTLNQILTLLTTELTGGSTCKEGFAVSIHTTRFAYISLGKKKAFLKRWVFVGLGVNRWWLGNNPWWLRWQIRRRDVRSWHLSVIVLEHTGDSQEQIPESLDDYCWIIGLHPFRRLEKSLPYRRLTSEGALVLQGEYSQSFMMCNCPLSFPWQSPTQDGSPHLLFLERK